MKCARCTLGLQPGSSHTDAKACVEALLHDRETYTRCATCNGKVGCLSCSVKKLAAREIKKNVPSEITKGLKLLGKILEE